MSDPVAASWQRVGSGRGPVTLGERLLIACVRAPLIVASTVMFGTVSLLGSIVDSGGRFQHWCARNWGRALLALCGVRLRVSGAEVLGGSNPYILCANHQSDIDIPVLLAALPVPFRFAAKKSLFRIPFLGWHLRRAGHVPIDRENPRAALRALDGSAQSIRTGLPVVVFPEGRISQDGNLAGFKRGAFFLAERTGASLVPVAIRGTRDILKPSSWILRSGPVEVTVGPVIPSNEVSVEALRLQVRQRILEGSAGPS